MTGVFTRTILAGAAALGLAWGGLAAAPAHAAGKAADFPAFDWSFDGVFGTYDMASAQRGLQIYIEVCSSCHGMDHLYYRHLTGLGLTEEEINGIAGQFTVMDGPDEFGDMFERPAEFKDRFANPYANEQQARSFNNGAYPVDLSLIAKARYKGSRGPDYLASLMLGYSDPPGGQEAPPGMHYNEYYPGNWIAMPEFIIDDGVIYQDGTEATAEQQAKDIAHFLMWAAEPHMVDRKQTGVQVILFLIVFAGMMYAVKRKIWANVEH